MTDSKDDTPCRLSLNENHDDVIIKVYLYELLYLGKSTYFVEKGENVDWGPGDQEHKGEGAEHDVGP